MKRQLSDREHSWSTKWDSRDFYFKQLIYLLKDKNLRDEVINLVNEAKWVNLVISIVRKIMRLF